MPLDTDPAHPNQQTGASMGCFVMGVIVIVGAVLLAFSSYHWFIRCLAGGVAFFLFLMLMIMQMQKEVERKEKGEEPPEEEPPTLGIFTPEAGEIPTREFAGWVKCHRADQRGPLGDLVMKMGFPLFTGVNVEGGVKSEEKVSETDKVMVEVARARGFDVLDLPNQGGLHRRYAGDLGQIQTLERGRYYTVCEDATGMDGNTLANELNAYTDPDGSVVMAMDLAYPNPFYKEPLPGLALLFCSIPGVSSPIIAEAQRRVLMPPDQTRWYAEVGYTVSELRREKVLDLRYPEAQEWLYQQFGGVVENASPDDGFLAMLPTLMANDIGGNDLTNAVGSLLRNHGVDALVFPSARSNVFTEFEEGKLVRWGGWNLVDYWDADRMANERILWKQAEWERFVDTRQRFTRAPLDSPQAGSFRAWGIVEHHQLLRHLMLCLKVTKAIGKGTDVKGYRWHTTQLVEEEGKSIFIAKCCGCGQSFTVKFLYGFPDHCPSCDLGDYALP